MAFNNSNLQLSFPLLFLIGTMFSCIAYKNIDFQAMRPAQVKLGTTVDKVDIHCEFCQNKRMIYQLDSAKRIEALASTLFLQALKSNLEKSPVFQNTSFSMITSDSLFLLLKDHKTRVLGNGLVILLDSVLLQDTIVVQRQRFSNNNLFTYGVIHKFGCRTYNKADMQVIDNYLLEDTLFWPPQFSEWEVSAYTPPVIETFNETGEMAGKAYAHYLAPYWVDESRIFYFGYKRFFKDAYHLVQSNKLDSALNILMHPAKKLGKNFSMMRLHNIAVIYELKDDIERAYLNADSAYLLKKNEISKKYTEKLRIRKLDRAALDWQLNRIAP